MRLQTLLWFYRRRLRVHWMQELLAGLGIAAGVALLFSVQVANSSITASERQMLHAITGDATLQLAARDERGLDAGMVARVERLPSVLHAAPVLEERGALLYRGHRVAVNIVGVDRRLRALNGSVTRDVLFGGIALERGLLLPARVAHELGIPDGAPDGLYRASVSVRGQSSTVAVSAVFGAQAIGSVSDASLAVMYLPYAQRLVGLPSRVTRILVVPRPGQKAKAERQLIELAAGHEIVAPIDVETRMFDRAAAPNDQATGLFAAVSALVGLLFTFNAMLLTLPERRAAIAELRVEGYRPSQLGLIVGFQTLVLGAVASTIGLVAGDLLSGAAARNPPSYLAYAFPTAAHRIVPVSAIVLGWAGGVLATCLAGAGPMLDARGSFSTRGIQELTEPGNGLAARTRRSLAFLGIVLAAATSCLVLVVPSTALVAILGIAVATVMIIPLAFTLVLPLLDLAGRRWRRNALVLAVRAVRATPIRSLALAATGAVAIFGSISIEGAHGDLLRGLYHNSKDFLHTADLWVVIPGDENSLTTESFTTGGRTLHRLRALPSVKDARPFYGGLLDSGDRRLWVTGRSTQDRTLIPPSQLKDGDLNAANLLLRHGGWVAVSESVVQEQHTHVGGRLTLPTPSGLRSFRVAAALTNLGWGPGAVVLSAPDYARVWQTTDPSAIEITLRPGSNLTVAGKEVRAALPRDVALTVQTTAERDAQFRRLARQGLGRLSQISTLLLVAAAIAMAAAMGAAIWQRRVALARMRIDGYTPAKLWQTLLLETAIVLGVGCLLGALTGTYGHVLGAHWLELSTGFPAPTVITPLQPVATSLLVAAVALAVTAVPGLLASRTPARVGLQE
jgi:putative ABC transport system permease protein